MGDANKVEGDLRERCLQELLGKYLRFLEPSHNEPCAFGENDTGRPTRKLFRRGVHRVYAPYAMVENVALALQDG